MTGKEMINHPAHYNQGAMECIDAIVGAYGKEEAKIFCKINAFKYLWRLGHKDAEEQELGKIRWYLDKYLELGTEPVPQEPAACTEIAGFKVGDIVQYENPYLSRTLGRPQYHAAEIESFIDYGGGVVTVRFSDGASYGFTDISKISEKFKKLS